MFWKKYRFQIDVNKNPLQNPLPNGYLTIDALRTILSGMDDAEIIERKINDHRQVTLVYIRTLIEKKQLNESVIDPLNRCTQDTVYECMASSNISKIVTLDEAQNKLLSGSVVLYDLVRNEWWAVVLENPLGRAVETSETETVMYGPKDSFTEQLDQNITLIRRRLPLPTLKTEKFTVGSLTQTKVIVMYIEGLTNAEFISIAKSYISKIDFDIILDSSHLAAFMDDNSHSVFPHIQQTDRPDACAAALADGKLLILVANTPFALIAPITFFSLFQSPEDYIHRSPIATFMRWIRLFSFFMSMILVPVYVALTTYHYQMIPLQLLFVLLESRSKLPFTPFWEASLMLIAIEIMKEASLRMPTKSGQTLGIIGGIVIGEAAVQAGFASKVLIVLVGLTAISSFLVPNYLVTKSITIIQFIFLVLAASLGFLGIVIGMIGLLIHLNGLTSLKQPYFAPLSPLYWNDWKDVFVRVPLPWMKTRPEYLHPLQKWRSNRRRS